MTSYVLIVENDEEFSQTLISIINEQARFAHATVVTNRDEACSLLDENFYDFAILDLSIPTKANSLDESPDHGKFVFQHARLVAPGTKLLVLTGSPSEDFIADLLAHKHDADIWAEGAEVNTVDFLRKIDLASAPQMIGRMLGAVESLDDIELAKNGLNLSIEEDRLIRIFARKFQAVRCEVTSIGPGKSGARPLRLRLFDETGAAKREIIAKLGPIEKIRQENAKHTANVVLLDGGSTPPKLTTLEYGARNTGGIYYQLATGYDDSLFALLARDESAAAEAVRSASLALAPWSAGVNQSRWKIRDIRERLISNEKFEELKIAFGLDWADEFESKEVQVRWCCVHGDFHGGNTLVSNDGKAVVIDFGDVGMGLVSYDPISLELSAVLQENEALSPDWPDEKSCSAWKSVSDYTEGSQIGLFVGACRSWAANVAAGEREIATAAYCYLVKQLKYDDTDKKRILQLLGGVRQYMSST